MIKPGDLYVDCGMQLKYCIEADYENDDIEGISLYGDNANGCCSPRHCGPELLSHEEVPFAIVLQNNLSPEYLVYYTYDSLKWVLSEEGRKNFELWIQPDENGDIWFKKYIDRCIQIIESKLTYKGNNGKIKYFYIAEKYLKVLIKIKNLIKAY